MNNATLNSEINLNLLFKYSIFLIEKLKWVENSNMNSNYPTKWIRYIKNFEDAKHEYNDNIYNLHKSNNDDYVNEELSENMSSNSNRIDNFIYADVIKNDLSIFKGKIR